MGQTSLDFLKEFASESAKGKLDLPPFPDVAMRVRKLLSDPNCTVKKAVRVISTEPILSAKLIRMANPAAFHINDNIVTDLRTAVSRIGFNMVRNTAISIAMNQVFDTKNSGALKSHLEKLWRHSLKTAAISYVLAKRLNYINSDEAMLAGLVHDIGKFYILVHSVKYPELFKDETSLQNLMDEWHTGIGKAILETWGFSEEMAHAVDEHEILERDHIGAINLTNILMVANLLSYMGGTTASPYKNVCFGNLSSFKRMGLDETTVIKVLAHSKKEIDSLAQALRS